ncbi:MAG: hypothetical protein GY855_03265, partial [candidate division Zixibacteria bacterium]|nr:hypothetical protein [candidate division Zixibacteria bacterium]
MKKLLILCLTLSVMTGVSFAANLQDGYRGIPVVCDSSDAPDDFGYTWVDSDNGGSPPFNWFDITTIGTEVEGLADDNNVGPISMGFNFPYYWYEVNRMWIGSNGYISFSSGANFAHPFADIPFRSQPNDLIAVLAGDLDFSRGNPSCYYWSNNTDSFVVSWLNVGEFGYIDSLHNCQVVFDATDSSVTFYYGEQHGDFFDSNGENRVVIGMENATGNVGLQYLRDNAPPVNMYHDGLALRFHPDPDPTFEAHDLGTYWVFNEGNGAKLHATGNSSV